jgi:hypothetical protein
MKRIAPRGADPLASEVIRLGGDEGRRDRTNWGFLLVVFMRVVSGLWVLRGLLHWQTILSSDLTPFEALPPVVAACVVFFAVADLIAAVGLWLASAWGGVLWLFAVSANIIVTMVAPEFHAGGRSLLAIDVGLIVAYFVLTWFAAHERDT